jgi:S-adenosylmethionine hydrolase
VIVALLTDFGTRDHYVGAMKGVVLSVCPAATLVDITHDIPPQDILTGALELAAAYRYFPAGSVFLAVVDPGVGSARRGIAADAGGYRFVGPDNGVLSLAFGSEPALEIVELGDRQYARPTVSRTFEGRDRFAPAAGWLARGTELHAFGPAVTDPVRLTLTAPTIHADAIHGEVVRIDRFGNLITNIDRQSLDALTRGPIHIDIGGRRISGLVSTYADVDMHEPCALVGSSGHLEIAVNGGNAAATLHTKRGDTISVISQAPGLRPQAPGLGPQT